MPQLLHLDPLNHNLVDFPSANSYHYQQYLNSYFDAGKAAMPPSRTLFDS